MKLPDAVPFEPLEAAASEAIRVLAETPGSGPRATLLAVDPQAQRTGWAAASAIALAEAWAARGEPVVLADLSLDRPELHERLGVDNEEGLSDVFLFGVSLPRITRPIPGKSFQLIPASPFTPDAREVLLHERWTAVLREMASGGTRLVAYLPMDVDGATEFSSGRFDVLVLGHAVGLAESANVRGKFVERASASASAGAGDSAGAVGAGAGEGEVHPREHENLHEHEHPHEHPPQHPHTPRSDAEFERIRIPKDGAREALIADLRSRQRAALMAPAPGMAPLSEAEGATTVRPPRQPRGEGTPGPIFRLAATHPTGRQESSWISRWLVLGVLLGVMIFAGWYWYKTQMAETTSPAPVAAVAVQPAGQVPAPAAAALPGQALPFSVAIASYQVLDLAEARVAQLSEDEPEIRFFVGPIAVQGAMYFRVMAGPAGDSASATALVGALVEKRIKTITSGWDVLTTPYAYLLGEYASNEDALAQQRTAARHDVPSYIIESPGPDGSTQYRVYAGAYAGHGDAEFMRPILKAAGLPENLVERTGSIRT